MDAYALVTDADFKEALAEATRLAAAPPADDTPEGRRLERTLSEIAAFHDAQPPERRIANLAELKALDDHLRAYGKRWPSPEGDHGEEHWSPMLGGDVHPAHESH